MQRERESERELNMYEILRIDYWFKNEFIV